jgi:enoyl-CoA hydratase
MSEDGRILEREAEGVARLTLDRPAKINALPASLLEDLALRLRRLGAREDLHLIVLEGAGPRGFCAGADVAELASGTAALRRQLDALFEAMLALQEATVPVAALPHGRCFGAGGLVVALADLVLAASDLRLGFPEIELGLYPGVVHAVLRTRLPEALAAQLCLGGRVLEAEAAQALGLVTEILPASGFATEAERRLAHYVARRAALRGARAMRPPTNLSADLRRAAPLLLANHADPGAQALLLGFLARRHSTGSERPGTQT